jgi:hypothetical protein
MAKKPLITVDGYKELRRDLRAVGQHGIDMLKAANKKAAGIVADDARPKIPYRTGTLVGTLRFSGTQRGGYVRMGSKAVPYAGPIHFGWPGRPNVTKGWRGGPIRPNPFLYDAADRRVDDVIDVYEQFLARGGPLAKLQYRVGGRKIRRGRHS